MKKLLLISGAFSMIVGAQTAQATVTVYDVTETFNQVVYDNSNPTWDTIFTGSFTFDSDTDTVSNLSGSLSAAMTGNTVWTTLTNPLSVVADGTAGLIVTVFKNNSVNTFDPTYAGMTNLGSFSGGTFGSNGKMGAVYTDGTQNAFATIYVPLADPTAALTQAQTDKLAYGDCTTAGLMGMSGTPKCMAGWNAYDASGNLIPGGTMKGTLPNIETITAAVPEPETYAMLLAGLGMMGTIAGRRRKTRQISGSMVRG